MEWRIVLCLTVFCFILTYKLTQWDDSVQDSNRGREAVKQELYDSEICLN
jgi:hypothetical protein